ncbi:MAG: LysM domain-containing protein, partial [Myxococcota bacterium]
KYIDPTGFKNEAVAEDPSLMSTADELSSEVITNDPSLNVGTLAPSTQGAASGDEETYTVKPGDSLSGIARDKLGSLDMAIEIYATNPQINDPQMIYPGNELHIPRSSRAPEAFEQTVGKSPVSSPFLGWRTSLTPKPSEMELGGGFPIDNNPVETLFRTVFGPGRATMSLLNNWESLNNSLHGTSDSTKLAGMTLIIASMPLLFPALYVDTNLGILSIMTLGNSDRALSSVFDDGS